MSTDVTTAKAAALFDDWADQGRAEGMEEGHGRTALPLLDALPFVPGMRLLDLGCGNGWVCRYAAERGAEATGLDASPAMVDRASKLAKKAGVKATFRQGDFAALPFDDDVFDLAWSMEAVYYASDVDAVLREVARVLAPGGAFHMVIDLYAENEASHSWPEDTGVTMTLRSEDEWVAAFEAAGFADVCRERLRAADPRGDAWKATEGSLHVWGEVA